MYLKGNKLSDRRLTKLINQCSTKQVLDYVKSHCPRNELSMAEANTSRKGKKGQKISESENVVESLAHKLRVLKVVDDTPVIKLMEDVKSIRPYIAACIVKNLSFTEESFKKFIQLQTRLHDGICEKRNAATIATHDLKLVAPGKYQLIRVLLLVSTFHRNILLSRGPHVYGEVTHGIGNQAFNVQQEVYGRGSIPEVANRGGKSA